MLLRKRRPGARRRHRLLVLGAVVLAGLIWWAREPLLRRYEAHRSAQAITRARTFVEKGDLRNAMLAVQVARTGTGMDATALRVIADILELQNDSDAMLVREQILRLAPDSTADRVACVRTALRFGQLPGAQAAFNAFGSAERNRPEVLRAEAMLLLAQHRQDDAERVLASLLTHDRSDPAVRVELAAIRLHSDSETIRNRSRTELEQLSRTGPPIAVVAIRELLRDAAERRDGPAARAIAEQLVHDPGATFDDHIRRLNIERTWPGVASPRIVAEVASRAAAHPAQAAQFIDWLVLTGSAARAVAFAESTPAEIRSSAPVSAALASAYATAKRWTELGRMLENGAWGPVQRETVRSTLAARETFESKQPEAGRKIWRDHLVLNARRYPDLVLMTRLAMLWSYDEEYVRSLRTIAENFTEQLWALQQLSIHFYRRGDTAGLRDTFALWVQTHPDNLRVRSDLIMATLLTTPGRPTRSVLADAKSLHDREPDNPYFATSFALALWRSENLPEALTLMEQLPLKDRLQPARAVYYSAFLAAANRTAEAAAALDAVIAGKLLPEEQALVQRTRERIAGVATEEGRAPKRR